MKKWNSDTNLVNGYEKRILNGYEKTSADLLKDSKMLSNAVKKCLGVEVSETLEDGTVVNVPVVTMIAAKKLAYYMEHPEKADLKELSSVLGEQKVEANINLQGAEELFGDIVNKDETE
jgi:hypothetical protein